MASDTSSAVLELNDGEAEETEPPSIVDDAKDGEPLIMEHGYDIAVKVDAPIKQLSTLETYVTYRVRCVCARWPTPPYVRRRYNHFKALYRRLCAAHPLLAPPPPPPLHSARQQLDRYSPSFVALRTEALCYFLDRIAKHPILTHSEDFRLFLTTPDEELDKVFKSENSALNLWGWSSALYSSSESKPSNGPRVKDPEFSSAADYLVSLQHKLTALCALTTKLYKDSAALGEEWLGMKRTCDVWASQGGGRGACALAAGAGAAGGAGGALRGRGPPPPPRRSPRALLPLTAAHAAALAAKIRERDTLHAAQVAGNGAGELHNRLEQASEAIRSELSDWTPKTRSEIKSILLDIAERQVNAYTQMVYGWEQALKLSTEANVEELFKTVSKTAVQNLSPSKCKADISKEIERDLEDMGSDNNSDTENDIKHFDVNNEENSSFFEAGSSNDVGVEVGSNEVLNGGNTNAISLVSDGNSGSSKKTGNSKEDLSKSEVMSDPLQSFSEIDLS